MTTHAILNTANIFSVKIVIEKNEIYKILNVFLDIVKLPCANQIIKHNVVQNIETLGAPFFAKPRRLAPDRF